MMSEGIYFYSLMEVFRWNECRLSVMFTSLTTQF